MDKRDVGTGYRYTDGFGVEDEIHGECSASGRRKSVFKENEIQNF